MVEVRHATVLDTGQQHLGTVYAKALLGATENAGNSEIVLGELDSLLRDVLDRVPTLEAVLCSPRVPYERKEQMLQRAFGGRMTLQLLNFLKVVARRGRFNCLRAIQQAARHLLNELRGRVEVTVRSAEPLDETMLTLVSDRLRSILGRDVQLQLKTDPELLGGLVIRVGDTVFDGSIANRLLRLRDDLVSKTHQKIRLELERFAKED